LTEQREQKSENNTARLFAEYARTRDPKLREQLIVQHLGLVSALARRFGADGRELDDLIQVGAIGLIQAIDRFDPSRGVAFRSYAVPTILGEMRRYFRDKASTIRLPRHLRELLTQANAASARLTQKLERPPSLDELAQAMSVPPEDLAVAEESAQAPVSLDQELPASEEEISSLADYFGAEDAEMARLEDRALINQVLSCLSLRERIILYLRFYQGLSQAEVAKRLHISQMHVSRLEHRALERVRQIGRQG
jgi:RNA polymerase sigma-B factor